MFIFYNRSYVMHTQTNGPCYVLGPLSGLKENT
jgi:hypothetical protein